MTDERAPGAFPRAPVSAVGPTELFLWILGLRKRTRVSGNSMLPTLSDGDTVLIQRANTAESGDIVVCRHPFKPQIQLIKRVADTTSEGLFLKGDNPPESTDSESLGRIPWHHLRGRVTSRFETKAANS